MTDQRRIRSDEHGPYVLTGGYAFRPAAVAARRFPGTGPKLARDSLLAVPRTPGTEELRERAVAELQEIVDAVDRAARTKTQHAAGDLVPARHINGTQTARVGDELWVSAETDPQYIRYTRR